MKANEQNNKLKFLEIKIDGQKQQQKRRKRSNIFANKSDINQNAAIKGQQHNFHDPTN